MAFEGGVMIHVPLAVQYIIRRPYMDAVMKEVK